MIFRPTWLVRSIARGVREAVALGMLWGLGAIAQPYWPVDLGTTVQGYQDDFTGTGLASGWIVSGSDVCSVGDGLLALSSASGDPNHLLYEGPAYDTSVQEILARIRIRQFGTGDACRGGVGLAVDPGSSQGINYHFRDLEAGRHLSMLDDLRAWGPDQDFAWQDNVWYWVRVRHEPDAASQGGVHDVFAKIWLADGSAPEPGDWQLTWDYTSSDSARVGWAGITAGSSDGLSEFDIDYVLLKAAGLPSIVVAPQGALQQPAAIIEPPQSQTVEELSAATFTTAATGYPPPTFQWYRDGAPMPAATDASYTLAVAALADSGARFQVVVENVVSNLTHSVTSIVATLTVLADLQPPVLLAARATSPGQVNVEFSERIAPATVTDLAHYSLAGPGGAVAIIRATLDSTAGHHVILEVDPLVEDGTYTLTVQGLTDLAAAANPIAPGSQVTFVALSYTAEDIGDPSLQGSMKAVPGGMDVSGGGTAIGGTADQFHFSHLMRDGDFDVRVRVASLSLSDPWAEAGLMVRESLDAGAPFASVLATPTISGCYFKSRSAMDGPTSTSGAFPVNYPDTWLRLQRAGNAFTGYASLDGVTWTRLGTATLALPSTVCFGFAVASHSTTEAATAGFRELSDVPAGSILAGAPTVEPPSPCSRRTSLVISEIMARPPRVVLGTNEARLEYVELCNTRGEPEDLSGYRLSGAIDYVFPEDTVIPGGGFVVVARVPADLKAVSGLADVLGPWSGAETNGLPNDEGTLQLRHRTGAMLLEIQYADESPWPVAAAGTGHSLVLARPSHGENNPRAWAASDRIGGSPGRWDPTTPDPLDGVVINEYLAHTDTPLEDYVELYNSSNVPKDLSGAWLSDDADTPKYPIPDGHVLAPGGFAWFTETTLGFALNSSGERLFLVNPDQTRVLDAVDFGPQENGVASGRLPDGGLFFNRLAALTPGTNNAAALGSPVVINEILFNPISGEDDDQYVELHNVTDQPIDLGGWRFTRGIDFTFPDAIVLAPHGFLIAARNAARLLTNYPSLTPANCLGDFQGRLRHGGERLQLAMPHLDVAIDGAQRTTNILYITVQDLTYQTGGAWPRWAAGGGSSLELRDPRSDNRLGANWGDSDETGKAPWTLVERRGKVDNLSSTANQLQVLLQGAGECLIDDVEVLTAAGSNRIANSTFETGVSGWTAQGTLSQSGAETGSGFNSTCSYHIRAVDRGDNQVNRIRTPLTSTFASGSTATLRARARWLRGHPGILLRLRGNGLEAAATLALPVAPGTPAASNSCAIAQAPPAIFDVAHDPVLPGANESIRVVARVADPDGIASVVLNYRIDPGTAFVQLVMHDDGTGSDAAAGDGLFTATVPGQASNVLVAFYVEAVDTALPSATSRFPATAPTRECLVQFGETVPTGNLPVYRLWMTKATFNAWSSRHKLDNTPNTVTFVLGSHRAIYGTSALFAGSPYIAPGFTTPSGNRCGYSITFPPDEVFLGNDDLVLDWPGGHGGESTAIQEQMAYWLADRMGLPFSHRHFIRLFVNGVTDMQRGGVFEAVLQPAGDFLRQWSPEDSDGDFYKIDRAFEFDDGGGVIADPMPRLELFTTPNLVEGGTMKKTERYRWTWLKRSYDTANNYTNLFALVDALNANGPGPYTSLTETLVDVEEWMGIFAFEHIINNFDSWGHIIGKNMYTYKPDAGRWQLYAFDLDWLMLVSTRFSSEYTASSGPLFNADDPTVARMYDHPPFRRAYFRAIQTAVDGPLLSTQCDPVMDAKYASLVANGITRCDGNTLANPSAVKTWFLQRRTALLAQLAAVNTAFTVAGATNRTVASNLVTLSGTAPIAVKTVTVNGISWPVTWATVNSWTLVLPVDPGTNHLVLAGVDPHGTPIPNTNLELAVVYAGAVPSPQGWVVINEIGSTPLIPDAEFVELSNASTEFGFDLSGWVFDGLAYTFPPGSFLAPGSFLVLVKDPVAFEIAHGSNARIFDEYPGNLQTQGETLTLIAPGAMPADDLIVDQVRYQTTAPWPTPPSGSSLQLVDVAQDNSRPANWDIGDPTQPVPARWVHFTTTGVATSSTLYVYLESAGDLYLDDLTLVAGLQPEVGSNLLVNGGFDSTLAGTWTLTANFAQSALSTTVKHSGASSLHLFASSGGSGVGNAIYQRITPTLSTGATYALSFWYLESTHGGPLTIRLSGTGLHATVDPEPRGTLTAVATPDAINSVCAGLPVFPPLWLNELESANLSGITDVFGEHEPWVELYNAGSQSVSLDGLFLADNLARLFQWPFPAGAALEPGEFKVLILDGQPDQSTATEWHTDFRLNALAGSVALTRLNGSRIEVLDHLDYAEARTNLSHGSYPDGQRIVRFEFNKPTPGLPNALPLPSSPVRINEWMASNTGLILDPADEAADDWFELYNPNSLPVDLTGYALTDSTNEWNQSVIRAGIVIPAGGFALVWADGHPERNAPDREFHADFQLSKNGDHIALYSPVGELLDLVHFGPQTSNVSEGRYPDGADSILAMDDPSPREANRLRPEDAPPQLTVVRNGTQLTLQWTSLPRRFHQVEHTADLQTSAWEILGTYEATGDSQSITISLGLAAQGFYRVVVLP